MNGILSSGMLAAALMVGQTSEPSVGVGKVNKSEAPTASQPAPAKTPAAAQPGPRPIIGWFQERPLVTKFQSFWKRDQDKDAATTSVQPTRPVKSETPPTTVTPTPITPSNDFPRKLPNPSSKAKTPGTTMAKDVPALPAKTVQQTAASKPGVSPILPAFAERIGRDEKFEWITGQFEVENGNFVMYYATPETVDKYHGRVVLLPHQGELNTFKRGDLVSVRGTISQRQTAQGVVPIYRVEQAHLIERAK